MLKVSVILFFVVFSFTAALAQTKWELNSRSDGIKIYTGVISGSNIRVVKVECAFKAKMSQFVAILLDVENSADWLYRTKICKVIRKDSPQDLYYYSIINLPSPAKNRDFVCHLTVNQDRNTKIVTINGQAEPSMVPLVNDIVRIKNANSQWTITPEANGMLKVVYTLQVNPEGNLPADLVNTFITDGPEQIFDNLRSELEKSDYKRVTLPFIQN